MRRFDDAPVGGNSGSGGKHYEITCHQAFRRDFVLRPIPDHVSDRYGLLLQGSQRPSRLPFR